MRFKRKERAAATFWVVAAGVVAGLAAVTLLAVRAARRRRGQRLPPDLDRLEKQVIGALREDPDLRGRGIDVAAIAPGIIELTGYVESELEAHHAVDVVQSVGGVRTVLNRLDLSAREQRLRRAGRAESGGSRWYGMGVGMGRRRQSRSTDPERRDGRADMVEHALAPDPEDIVAELADERNETRASAAGELS